MVRSIEHVPSFIFALVLGVLLIAVAIALSRGIALRAREPSDYLSRTLVRVVAWERDEGKGRLASYLSEIGLPSLPHELRSSVAPERVIALLSGSGMMMPLIFHRILSSEEASDRLVAYSEEEGATVRIVGPYLVLGQGVLLDPRSPDRLRRDPRFRAAAGHIPAHSSSAIYVQRQPESHFPLSLPPLLLLAVSEEPWMVLTKDERTDEAVFSVILPSSSRRSQSSVLSALVSGDMALGAQEGLSLLFGVSGTSVGSELQKVLQLLSGDKGDQKVVLEGILHAAFADLFGKESELRSLFPLLRDTPYAFLLSEARLSDGQGSGGTLAWLFAAEQREGPELMEAMKRLQVGFSSRFPLAMVRERTLPSGRVVRDVVSDSRAFTKEEESYRGYRIVRTRHRDGQELIRGGRGNVMLLSNEIMLLRRAIGSLANASLWGAPDDLPQGTTHTVIVTHDALRRSAPLIGDAPFVQSLHSFLSERRSMRWFRVAEGQLVRHTFLFP